MPTRFATVQQIAYVASLETEIGDYQQKFIDIVNFIAGLIEAVSPSSGIETRLISSKGDDNEKWLGALRSASLDSSKVDVWCITFTLTEIQELGQGEAVGSFDKPFGLGIDYFYDYDFGIDGDDFQVDGTPPNSEWFFNKQVDAFEFILEQLRTASGADCLPHDAMIQSAFSRRMITRFTNASAHRAKFDLALKLSGL